MVSFSALALLSCGKNESLVGKYNLFLICLV